MADIKFSAPDKSFNDKTKLSDILRGASAFQNGVQFKITDCVAVSIDQMDDKKSEKSPSEARRHLLLVTDIPTSRGGYNGHAVIWLSSSYIPDAPNKIDRDGNFVVPDGTFDKILFDTMRANLDKTLTEICAEFVRVTKDLTATVRRKPYIEPRYNRVASIPCFDIVG